MAKTFIVTLDGADASISPVNVPVAGVKIGDIVTNVIGSVNGFDSSTNYHRIVKVDNFITQDVNNSLGAPYFFAVIVRPDIINN